MCPTFHTSFYFYGSSNASGIIKFLIYVQGIAADCLTECKVVDGTLNLGPGGHHGCIMDVSADWSTELSSKYPAVFVTD